MPVCGDCGGTVIEYDAAAGNGFCVTCGTVVEENTIVAEVTFGETSAGAAIVQGSYVGHGSTHARMSGPFGNRGSSESREQTIANASRKIRSVANVMRLSEVVQMTALRMYTLALEHKFTKGRKNMNVIAVCLYVACRQKETRNYMLIDFSDLLQVNVFELGHTYLQLVQTLNLRLPLVDPSHYISRFASLLEFGEETPKVATDAIRLVQRFDRDWMTKGRRPAGICGASLLLAARMNNFRRSIQEIVQVVKIADTTVKQRLNEFKKTPSGALTLADFRTVWLEDEMDPPAFTKGREKEAEETESEGSGTEVEGRLNAKGRRKKKTKRKRSIVDAGVQGETIGTSAQTIHEPPIHAKAPIDPILLQQGIFESNEDRAPLFLPDEGEVHSGQTLITALDNSHIDPSLLIVSQSEEMPQETTSSRPQTSGLHELSDFEQQADKIIADEVNDFLTSVQGNTLAEALIEAEQRRHAQFAVVDELLGLDEDELDDFILSPDEVLIKERVWVEMNKDYLEAIAARDEQKQRAEASKSKKRRKTSVNTKPRDSSTPQGNTPAEAVRYLIKKTKKFSRRINYEALNDLFVDGIGIGSETPSLVQSPDPRRAEGDFLDNTTEGDDQAMYHYDDRSDAESVLVIVDETELDHDLPNPDTPASKLRIRETSVTKHVEDISRTWLDKGADDVYMAKLGKRVEGEEHESDEDADGVEDIEGEGVKNSEYGYTEDYYGWEEGYEQEV